ncbi:MAG TPA: hypothetical protein VHE35_16505 [Kofleriaceae bacterium]|nr:hypothetical protein [Kofleriaceae bacterium]
MFALYNFVPHDHCDEVVAQLTAGGYSFRRLDGGGLRDATALWEASARQLGHGKVGGWDGYLDDVGRALLPDDDESDHVALLWLHADHLAGSDLGAFCAAFDALTTVARAAYAQGTTILLFFFGDDFKSAS